MYYPRTRLYLLYNFHQHIFPLFFFSLHFYFVLIPTYISIRVIYVYTRIFKDIFFSLFSFSFYPAARCSFLLDIPVQNKGICFPFFSFLLYLFVIERTSSFSVPETTIHIYNTSCVVSRNRTGPDEINDTQYNK